MLCSDGSNIVSIVSGSAQSSKGDPELPSNDSVHINHLCWLLFAIEDLSEICQKNGLAKSFAALENASRVIENEILPNSNRLPAS
jgi:hypothetical protein